MFSHFYSFSVRTHKNSEGFTVFQLSKRAFDCRVIQLIQVKPTCRKHVSVTLYLLVSLKRVVEVLLNKLLS